MKMFSEKHNSGGYQNRKSQEGEKNMLSKLHQNLICFSLRHVIQVELKSDSNRADESSKVTCPSMSFNKKRCFN
jgi:hypothetical protein